MPPPLEELTREKQLELTLGLLKSRGWPYIAGIVPPDKQEGVRLDFQGQDAAGREYFVIVTNPRDRISTILSILNDPRYATLARQEVTFELHTWRRRDDGVYRCEQIDLLPSDF